MARLYETLLKFFEEKKWLVTRDDEDQMLTVSVTGKNGNWLSIAKVLRDPGRFVFASILPVEVPETRQAEVVEFLARMNCDLVIPGHAEMDFEDGEVRFSSSVWVEECEVTVGMIRPTVVTNITTTDRYLPAIQKVICYGVSAASAIKEIDEYEAMLPITEVQSSAEVTRPILRPMSPEELASLRAWRGVDLS